jgi:hypothetical protein
MAATTHDRKGTSPPIPRPVRNLASMIRQFAIVSDAFVDMGETSAGEAREWLTGYMTTLHEDHSLRREWNKATQNQQSAVFVNWERLRGKTLKERAAASVEHHNQHLRRKYPLFADDKELLAQIGVRYPSPEEECRKWREGAEQRYRLARDPNRQPPAPTIEQEVRARFQLREDESEGGRLSLNQARVWR